MLLRRYHGVEVSSAVKLTQGDSTNKVNEDIEKLTVPELRELAKLAEVANYSKLRRAELIDALG